MVLRGTGHNGEQQHHSELLEPSRQSRRLRIDPIRAPTAAGSGRPTSCASAAEIVIVPVPVPFFSVMSYDPRAAA